MTKPKLIVLGVLLLACIAASIFWQQRTLRRLESENAGLRERTAGLESLRDENLRLAQAQVDPAELERLRRGQSELLRLRGEVSQLRQQLKEEQRAAAKRAFPVQEAPPSTAPGDEPVAPVETYTADTRAIVAPRQNLVTGGWTTPSGKRALFFIQPEIDGADVQAGQITLQTWIVELPETALTQLGLDGLKSAGKQSSTQAILTTEQAEAILKALENTAGVDLLSMPKITTLHGRQARVQVSDVKTISGETFEVGPSVDILPHLSADRTSVDLTVSAQLRLQASPSR